MESDADPTMTAEEVKQRVEHLLGDLKAPDDWRVAVLKLLVEAATYQKERAAIMRVGSRGTIKEIPTALSARGVALALEAAELLAFHVQVQDLSQPDLDVLGELRRMRYGVIDLLAGRSVGIDRREFGAAPRQRPARDDDVMTAAAFAACMLQKFCNPDEHGMRSFDRCVKPFLKALAEGGVKGAGGAPLKADTLRRFFTWDYDEDDPTTLPKLKQGQDRPWKWGPGQTWVELAEVFDRAETIEECAPLLVAGLQTALAAIERSLGITIDRRELDALVPEPLRARVYPELFALRAGDQPTLARPELVRGAASKVPGAGNDGVH